MPPRPFEYFSTNSIVKYYFLLIIIVVVFNFTIFRGFFHVEKGFKIINFVPLESKL